MLPFLFRFEESRKFVLKALVGVCYSINAIVASVGEKLTDARATFEGVTCIAGFLFLRVNRYEVIL